MKKTRFIALAMVVAIMLMGAGYGAWTDFTEVTGTVDTGELDVGIRWASLSKPDYTDGSISHDDNTITFNLSDLYPTVYNAEGFGPSYARVHFSVENHGTIPVKLDSIEFVPTNPDSPVWDHLRTVVHIHHGTPSATGTSLSTKGSLTGTNPLSGNLIDLDSLLLGTQCTLDEFVLMPGEAIWFGGNTDEESSIRFYLHKDAENDTMNESFGFTLKLNWKQFNM
jgi:hypothetical protein